MNVSSLKSARVKKGLTQTEISKIMGITHTTYNRKELGVVEFVLSEVEQVSQILDLNLDEVNEIFFDNKITECIYKKKLKREFSYIV